MLVTLGTGAYLMNYSVQWLRCTTAWLAEREMVLRWELVLHMHVGSDSLVCMNGGFWVKLRGREREKKRRLGSCGCDVISWLPACTMYTLHAPYSECS
jgi:hypothetical protein